MKRYIVIYLCALLVQAPLDLLFLKSVASSIFYAHVGDMLIDEARIVPAVLFYLLYALGVVLFVNGAQPANWKRNACYGALFGLMCYGTFELTCLTILKHWEWAVAIPDMAWGTVGTALAASLSGLLASRLLRKI